MKTPLFLTHPYRGAVFWKEVRRVYECTADARKQKGRNDEIDLIFLLDFDAAGCRLVTLTARTFSDAVGSLRCGLVNDRTTVAFQLQHADAIRSRTTRQRHCTWAYGSEADSRVSKKLDQSSPMQYYFVPATSDYIKSRSRCIVTLTDSQPLCSGKQRPRRAGGRQKLLRSLLGTQAT